MIVVDDTLLVAVLAGSVPPGLQQTSAARELATTGSCYWRLGRAVLDPTSAGTLSRAFAQLSGEGQRRVETGLHSLPAEIGLVSLRRLVPVMSALDSGRRLNLLTAEAIASALLLDADIAVTTRSAAPRRRLRPARHPGPPDRRPLTARVGACEASARDRPPPLP